MAAAALPIAAAVFGKDLIKKVPGVKDLFKTPKPPEAPPVIAPDTLAVQQKAGETSKRRARASGYRSTILSQQFMTPDAPALKDTIGS